LHDGAGEASGFVWVQVDAAANRARAVAGERELRSEPVGRDSSVGIGAGDKAFWQTDVVQPLAREVHACASRVTGARGGRVEQDQPQLWSCGSRAKRDGTRVIATLIEDENDFERVGLHALLPGEGA
jgi:hypothetical protein